MGHSINDQENWDHGKSFGMCLGLAKYVELYFDYLKTAYIDKLYQIMDLDLMEHLHDTIYSNERSRHELQRILNSIEHAHREQMSRKENEISD